MSVAAKTSAAELTTSSLKRNALPDSTHERWRYAAKEFAALTSAPAQVITPPTEITRETSLTESRAVSLRLTFDAEGRAEPVAVPPSLGTFRPAASDEADILFPRGSASPGASFYGPAVAPYILTLRAGAKGPDGAPPLIVIERTSSPFRAESESAFALAVLAEPEAEAEIFQTLDGPALTGRPDAVSFRSLRVRAGEGAKLRLRLLITGDAGAALCSSELLELEAGADVRSCSAVLGGRVCKLESTAVLQGEGASVVYSAALLGDGDHFTDYSAFTLHRAPGSRSAQNIKQLLTGNARGVYYGRAEIPQDAPGCEAYQRHRCLLLSSDARAYARPELDIRTDQVACSHGSATGGPDENALFYLRSRGMTEAEALSMLAEAFLAPDEADVPNADEREALNLLTRAAVRRACSARRNGQS